VQRGDRQARSSEKSIGRVERNVSLSRPPLDSRTAAPIDRCSDLMEIDHQERSSRKKGGPRGEPSRPRVLMTLRATSH
jgi:hypothetical protein